MQSELRECATSQEDGQTAARNQASQEKLESRLGDHHCDLEISAIQLEDNETHEHRNPIWSVMTHNFTRQDRQETIQIRG